MKKSLIYSMILATALFSSCKGDYDDWASPQGYVQEEAKNVALTITPASAIDMSTVETDSVNLFSASIESQDPMTLLVDYTVELGKADENGTVTAKQEIKASASGNVAKADLVSAVETLYGKAPEQRTLQTVAVGSLMQNGLAFYTKSNQVQTLVTLVKHDISSSYYLVGDMTSWDAAGMIKFTHSDTNVYDDPVFKISFETTADNQYWKIIPQENVDGDFWANPGVVGPSVDGDDSMSGSLVNEGCGAGKIATAGKYIMTINMMDYTYSIEAAPTELYMTGSEYGWSDWKQLIPIYGTDDQFWTVVYLAEGEQFKFAPQAGWGNDFGYTDTTVKDEAGAGITSSADGNLVAGNAGWFLFHVTNGTERIFEVLEPNVYLIGDAVGEWNIGASHKFTVPTSKDGEFVSPAFAKDAELRMCVSIDPDGWWKTEFIIANGKIDYRGKGGDQDRLNVSAGQKAYLNFTTGAAEVK